jgi:hypothetical protein
MSSQIANTEGAADQVAAAFGWPDYAADESDDRTLTPVRARLYAHAFHVDLEWLLSGEGELASDPDSVIDTTSVFATSADELAEWIERLTDTQRAALLDFLRALQEN